jgi:YVTN family beta-propeller protein
MFNTKKSLNFLKRAVYVVMLYCSTAAAREYAYVANNGDNTVSVIRLSDNVVTDTIKVGSGPIGVAGTSDGRYVYVANNNDGTVSIIRTSDNSVVGSAITVGSSPTGIAIIGLPPLAVTLEQAVQKYSPVSIQKGIGW